MAPRRSKRAKVNHELTVTAPSKETKATRKPRKATKTGPKAKKSKVLSKSQQQETEQESNPTLIEDTPKVATDEPNHVSKARSNSRGALKDLLEMPLDIICEVRLVCMVRTRIPSNPLYPRYFTTYSPWTSSVSPVSIQLSETF